MADSINWAGASAAIATWVRGGSGLDQQHVFWAYEGVQRPAAPYIEMSVQQLRPIGYDWHTYEDNPLVFAPLTISAVSGNHLTITGHALGNGDGPVRIASTGTLPAPLAAGVDYWVIVVDANTIEFASSYVATGGQQPLGAGNTITPIHLTTSGSGAITLTSTASTLKAGQELIKRAQGFRELTVHLDCFVAEGKGYDAVRILADVMASIQLNLYALDQAGLGVSDLGQSFSQGGVQLLEGHRGGILEPRAMAEVTFYMASNLIGYETIITQISGLIEITREDGTTALPAVAFTSTAP